MGIDPQAVKKAQEMASKYPATKQGLMQAIADNGGINKAKEALNVVDKPLVKKGLGFLGINKTDINNVLKDVEGGNNVTTNATNSFMERLKKLR